MGLARARADVQPFGERQEGTGLAAMAGSPPSIARYPVRN